MIAKLVAALVAGGVALAPPAQADDVQSYLDVLQALEYLGLDHRACEDIGIRVYKVGMTWPLEPEGIRRFARGLEDIIVVEEKRRRGKHSYWQTLVDEEEGTDFLLLDDTGKAKVQVSYASAVLHGDAEGGSGFLNEPTPELDSFLSARGHSTQGWIFNKTIRFREGVAEPNERVAVVGMGKWERDPEEAAMAGEGYREAVMPKRLVLSAPSEGPLLLSDESDVTS